MTRAVAHLLRGDLSGALELHPLVIPVLVIATATWGWFVLHRLGKTGRLPSPLVNLTLSGLALALVGVWVARLTAGTLPPI
jgi:CDP-diglyceride synthetase